MAMQATGRGRRTEPSLDVESRSTTRVGSRAGLFRRPFSRDAKAVEVNASHSRKVVGRTP